MVDEPKVVDDPFERAARREARAARKQARPQTQDYLDPGRSAAAMVGTTVGWGIILALHGYLAGTTGWFFRSHLVLFTLFAAIAVGMLFYAVFVRLLSPKR